MSDYLILKAEISGLKEVIEDLERQAKNYQAERDLLAVMLNEAENATRRSQANQSPNLFRLHAAGEFEHSPATSPANRKLTVDQVLKLVDQMSPPDQTELERRLRARLNYKPDDGDSSTGSTPAT